MIEFKMPSLGADMDAGTLVQWFKQPGDRIGRGDIVALVETQKGAIEIEVFSEGMIGEHRIQPGQKVPVGTVIATILTPGEQAEAIPEVVAIQPVPEPASVEPPAPLPRPAAPVAAGQKITPLARRTAAERGIDLRDVAAGADGVIGIAEIEAAKPKPTTEAKPRATAHAGLDLAEMRKAIAAAMVRSHSDIPHYWVTHSIDVSPLMHWLEAENSRRPVEQRLLYVAPLIKAIALALKDVPELNGYYRDGAFLASPQVHLGVATSLRGGGLVAPAIRDVDTREIGDLMAALSDLVPRARAGRLRSSEMTDGTVTVSNLGDGSAESVLPLIYPPQVAIIGCGAILPRPWAAGDAIAVRQIMTVSVAGDHRVSHGRHAGQFLTRLETLLGSPEAL